ncbi:MAG TPA: tol-pal system protein YbgF [Smithellaceae bacterium]|nr:tol-pal system protein YbgF [Smithellaceae bacterium]
MNAFKYFVYLMLSVAAFVTCGCATSSDLRMLKSEMNQQMEEKLVAFDAKIGDLKKEQDKNSAALATIRKGQANTTADFSELRDQIQQLRGQIEALKKEVTQDEPPRKDAEVEEKLNQMLLKINFIENFLEIGRKDVPVNGNAPVAAPKNGQGKPDRAAIYASAYQLFQEGQYGKAREAFVQFLAEHPKSEYSDNAQFWIGECYFFEKKYEQAILEYDKVTKNYPGGNKVSYALLKQGLSFLNLGDKTSAKLLLQQVIREYPNTNQARIARSKLQEIK